MPASKKKNKNKKTKKLGTYSDYYSLKNGCSFQLDPHCPELEIQSITLKGRLEHEHGWIYQGKVKLYSPKYNCGCGKEPFNIRILQTRNNIRYAMRILGCSISTGNTTQKDLSITQVILWRAEAADAQDPYWSS